MLASMQLTTERRQQWERFLEIAQELKPFAAKYHISGEAPLESLAILRQAGLYGLGLAPDLPGSLNADVRTIVLAQAALATVDPATAMGFNMHLYATRATCRGLNDESRQLLAELGSQNLFSALTSEPGADSAQPETFNPSLRAEATDGGYLLSGTKKFASNLEASRYALVYTGDGQGSFKVMIVDTAQPNLTVKDIWHDALGMRNTRSNEATFSKVFVPTSHVLDSGDNFLMDALYTDDRLFYYTAVYMGLGMKLLGLVGDELATRKSKGKTLPNGYLQSKSIPFGESVAQLNAAWAVLWQAATMIDEQGISPVTMSLLGSAKLLVGKAVAQLIHKAPELAGNNGLLDTEIQRFMLDGLTAEVMPPSSSNSAEMIAHQYLGLNPALTRKLS